MTRCLPGSFFPSRIIAVLSGISLFFAMSAVSASAQQNNLERLQQCARVIADSIMASYGPGDTLCLKTVDHPASWLLDQAMLLSAEGRHVPMASCPEKGDRDISLAVTEIAVEYHEIDDADSLERRAHVALGATLPPAALQHYGSPGSRLARTFSVWLSDTVNAARTSLLETPGYDYTRGVVVTHSKPGFWDKIVEPAVILGASVVMVILLFSVRSQ